MGLRVAALYDIHANLPALEAVLAAVEKEQPDLIVIGGDIAWGPMPRETLELLTTLGDRAAFIRGNADREVADPDNAELDGWVAAINDWVAARLTSEQLSFLRDLPMHLSLDVAACGRTLFCHATPRADDETFTIETPAEQVAAMFSGRSERSYVCGHTHMQFDLNRAGIRLINAGSVGMPYEREPGAYWAMFDEDVQLRRTEYDYEAAARAIAATTCPEAGEIAAGVLSPTSPEEALAVFRERG